MAYSLASGGVPDCPAPACSVGFVASQGGALCEGRALADAWRQWVAWNRHMVRAVAQQGTAGYTRDDYDEWYLDGDGVPRDFGGRPFEPLSWGGVSVYG